MFIKGTVPLKSCQRADTLFEIPIQIHQNPRMGILMNLGGEPER
jgi:hypothetical protein